MLARAAARAQIPYILSGASLTRMEEVRTAGPTSWFQAYVPGEAEPVAALVDRVEAAGFETLVVTVDTAVHGQHELAAQHGFRSPVRLGPRLAWQGISRPGWLRDVVLRDRLGGTRFRFENMDAGPGSARVLVNPRARHRPPRRLVVVPSRDYPAALARAAGD